MSIKRLLYIDDNKIDSQLDTLKRRLKRSGYDLVETFLDLSSDEFKKRDEISGKTILDVDKIKLHIKLHIFQENYDVVASDYDYSDANLDGYILLKWIMNVSRSEKHKIRKAKFCLYSAQQDKLVRKIDSPDSVKELIKLRIDDFIDRDRLADDLTSIFIKESDTYKFANHIVTYLESFPELRFKSVYPKFKDKTLSEIANEIDKDLPNGIEFQKNLVELTIAHLINLNNQR